MQTRDELFRAAQQKIAAYRQQAIMTAEAKRSAAYSNSLVVEANKAHIQAGLNLTKAAAIGGNIEKAKKELVEANQALEDTLKQVGYSDVSFSPIYHCPKCQDTGTKDGVPCECVANVARCLRRDEINAAAIEVLPKLCREVLAKQSKFTFYGPNGTWKNTSCSRYCRFSPRKRIRCSVYQFCSFGGTIRKRAF